MRVTSRGALPVVADASMTGTGDALAAEPTWITFWAVPMAFELSFTVSLTT